MVIVMECGASEAAIGHVLELIRSAGLKVHVLKRRNDIAIGIIGDEKRLDLSHIRKMDGVTDVYAVHEPFKLASRSYNPDDVEVNVRGVMIGASNPPVYIAGPCSIESYEQLRRIAVQVKEAGAHILRGGAFKPRTSVHTFQGLGEEGLKYLHQVGRELNMPTITEVRNVLDIESVAKHTDMLQIGMRNARNQDLIEACARTRKPILLKRGDSMQRDEYLGFAERAIAEGNEEIVLCERGIIPLGGPYKNHTRFTFDLSIIPSVRKVSPLPIMADPSHATGAREYILPMSRAAIAAGAHGLIIEVHDRPDEALSDAAQALSPAEFKGVVKACNKVYEALR